MLWIHWCKHQVVNLSSVFFWHHGIASLFKFPVPWLTACKILCEWRQPVTEIWLLQFFGKTKKQLFTVPKNLGPPAITSASQYVVNLWPSMITHTNFQILPVFFTFGFVNKRCQLQACQTDCTWHVQENEELSHEYQMSSSGTGKTIYNWSHFFGNYSHSFNSLTV